MNKQAIQKLSFCTLFLALFAMKLLAQSTPPLVLNDCTNSTFFSSQANYTQVPEVIDFSILNTPAYAGYVITDIKVDIKWSKGVGTCGNINPTAATGLQEIGFYLNIPNNMNILPVALGYSAQEATSLGLNPLFGGTVSQASITTSFVSHNGLPQTGGLPIPNGAYAPVATGTSADNFGAYIGQSANLFGGLWELIVTDDAPTTTGPLCVEQFCITVTLCEASSFQARCKPTTDLYLNNLGVAVPTFDALNNNSDTSCLLRDLSFSSGTMTTPSFTCANAGQSYPVSMTLTSAIGQTSTCISTVTIRDTIPPVINCSDTLTFYLSDSSNSNITNVTITAQDITAYDNCNNPVIIRFGAITSPQNTVTYTCLHSAAVGGIVRPQPLSVIATDIYGNRSTCQVPVYVLDTVPPVAKCKPDFDLFLDNTGSASVNITAIDNSSTDNCSPRYAGTKWFFSPTSNMSSITYNCDSLGARNVVLYVVDHRNNVDSCTTVVTIRDTIRPIANCVANFELPLSDAGTANVTATMINNGSSDNTSTNCNLTYALIPTTALNCNNIGIPTPYTLTVTDAAGNSATCTTNITARDTTAPEIICYDITLNVGANGIVSVNPTMLDYTINEACTPINDLRLQLSTPFDPTLVNSLQLSCAPLRQDVILHVTDLSGNMSSCHSSIYLIDTIPPVANCVPTITLALDNNGQTNIAVADVNNNSTDNCGTITTTLVGRTTFDCSDIGISQNITLRVEDQAGLFATCTSIINIIDTIAPTANCINDTTLYLNTSGTAILYADQLDNPITPSTDNCGQGSIAFVLNNNLSNITFDCNNTGTSTVNFVVIDAQNLRDTCPVQVTILDTIKPDASCVNITREITPGISTITVTGQEILGPAAFDVCGIDYLLINGANSIDFDCATLGTYNTTLSIFDTNGNFSECIATVTILDKTPPVARCRVSSTTNPIPVQINAAGNAIITPATINLSSADNCGRPLTFRVNHLDSLQYTFNCTQVNTTQRVQLFVYDQAGNTSNCEAFITLQDRIAPIADCQPTVSITLPAVNNPSTTIPASQFNRNSTDNCSNNLLFTVNGQANLTYNCANIGNTPITLTVSDGTNTAICRSTLVVTDNTPPVAACIGTQTLQLDATGNITINASSLNNGSIDNCSGTNLTYSFENNNSSMTFTCANIGIANTVKLYVSDAYGNTDSSCTTTITIEDNIAPVINCSTTPFIADLSPVGDITINATQLATATDACGTPVLTINNNPSIDFTCANIAQNPITVTVTATDLNGNTSTCPAIIEIRDITLPEVTCQTNFTVQLDAIGQGVINVNDIHVNSNDACGIANLALDRTTFSCADIASNINVTLTATDNNGLTNTCATTINVIDNTPPVALCLNTLTIELDSFGVGTLSPVMLDNGSTDACSPVSFSFANNSTANIIYGCADLAVTHNVTLYVSDIYGNVDSSCATTITVVDNIAPVMDCSTTHTVYLDRVGLLTVPVENLVNPTTVIEGCNFNLSINNNNSVSFSCDSVGTRTILVTATDNSNNSSTCPVTVIVQDTVAPSINFVRDTIFLVANGMTTIDPMMFDNNSVDACGIAAYRVDPAQIDCSVITPQNNTISINFIVEDIHGNIATRLIDNIVVLDTIVPDMTNACIPFTAYLNNTGSTTITPANILGTPTDNCAIDINSYRINNTTSIDYSCLAIGTNTVTLSVSDVYGNNNECIATVTVLDTIPPTAICDTLVTAYVDPTGIAAVIGTMLDKGSNDACDIDSSAFLVNGVATYNYDCSAIGIPQIATLTVFDMYGNSATCTSTINILDTLAPAPNCITTPITLTLNAVTGRTPVLNVRNLSTGGVDNCNGTLTYLSNGLSQLTFDCSQVGTNIVPLTVTDIYGNDSTCTAEVFVMDNVAPDAHCLGSIILTLPSTPNATVTLQALELDNNSYDNCGIVSYLINGQDSLVFDCSNIATAIAVDFVVVDAAGNTDNCANTVTIQDITAPTAICTPTTITVALDATGIANLTPTMVDNGSFDNCSDTIMLVNGLQSITYNCAQVGTHTVTLSVTDHNGTGLTGTCTATVEIIDNIAPTVICIDTIITYLNVDGQSTINATALDNGSTDACLPLNFQINGNNSIDFTCQNIGINPITLTVTDANGNAATCITQILVRDTVAPIVTCTDYIAHLDGNGLATVTPQMVATSALDSCGIRNYQFIDGIILSNNLTFDCNAIGNHNVSVIVTDINNNATTCAAIITVQDTVAPTITCRDTVLVNLNRVSTGFLNQNLLVVNGSITDNCDIDRLSFSQDSVTCADANTIVPVTVTVLDVNGNFSTCISNINVVLDTPTIVAPSMVCASDDLALRVNLPQNNITYNITWTGPNGYTSTSATPTITNVTEANEGIYIVSITPTPTGCAASASVEVMINTVAMPLIAIDTPLCENSTATFTISNTSDFTQHSTIAYEWYKDGIALGISTPNLEIANATIADNGSYTLMITADNCAQTSAPFVLEITPLPTAPLLTSNTPCEMDVLVLEAFTDSTRTYTFAWSGPNGFTANTPNTSIIEATQDNAGLYTLLITDQFGCTVTNDISVTIAPKPQLPGLVYNDPLCADDFLEISDTNTYVITPNAFNWTLADGTTASTTVPQLVLPNPIIGDYALVVNMDGCFSDTNYITVAYQPQVIAINDELNLEFRDSVFNFSLVDNDSTNTAYSISIVQMPNSGTVAINPDGTLNYIAGYSSFGRDSLTYVLCDVNCPDNCDTAQVFITITADFECYIPEAITPNTDGINDVWNIRCINEYPNRQVSVFSRWGQLVYEGDGSDFDGKYKGEDLPDGTYFYILKLNDTTYVPNDTFKGHLIIRR